MSDRLQPRQKQDHQPGRETEMRPRPEYEPKYPGVGKLKDKVALITGGDSGIGRAVAPGPIWTPLIPASFDADHVAKHGAATPMKRAGQPNEVAPSYVFLASAEASYITGQVLHVNGGTVVGG